MIVRQFRESGIQAFRAFLVQARLDPTATIPLSLLEDDTHTDVVRTRLTVESRQFDKRGEAAKYLSDVLSPLPAASVAKNAGLWTWLSLFYFNEVCAYKNGKRFITNDYSYVFEPSNSRHYYRHL